jgi:hypothetical protein
MMDDIDREFDSIWARYQHAIEVIQASTCLSEPARNLGEYIIVYCDVDSDCLTGTDKFFCEKLDLLSTQIRFIQKELNRSGLISCTRHGDPLKPVIYRINWDFIAAQAKMVMIGAAG